MSAALTPEEKRRHLAAAKRWHGRKKGARSRLDKQRCHREAMRHLYTVLGHVPAVGGPLL
jgi:hypothetical protein